MSDKWPIGAPIEDLDTPAVILDIDVCQRNIDRMADFFSDKPCKLRPHFKNHKCTTLMRRQLAREAVGVTCAKVSEAEVLVEAGFTDILIANQVVGPLKVHRLLSLLDRAEVRVAVDCEANCRELSALAAAAGKTIGCLVEVEIGMKRCGLLPDGPCLEIARLLDSLPGVRFDGLQGFEGHTVLIEDNDQRNSATREAMELLTGTGRYIEENGLPVPIISGGGTGTYDLSGTLDGMDEIQAGTYPTMDWRYKNVRPEFDIALSVLATCISAAEPSRAVLDVGVKGVGAEFGSPIIRDRPDTEIGFFKSEEHCFVDVHGPAFRVGEKVQLIPSHACTTCNLHREIYVYQDERVVDVWPIEGSGKLR